MISKRVTTPPQMELQLAAVQLRKITDSPARRKLIRATAEHWELSQAFPLHERVPPCSGWWYLSANQEPATERVWYDAGGDEWHFQHENKYVLSPALPNSTVWQGLAHPAPIGYPYEIPGAVEGRIQRRPPISLPG